MCDLVAGPLVVAPHSAGMSHKLFDCHMSYSVCVMEAWDEVVVPDIKTDNVVVWSMGDLHRPPRRVGHGTGTALGQFRFGISNRAGIIMHMCPLVVARHEKTRSRRRSGRHARCMFTRFPIVPCVCIRADCVAW